MQSEFAWRIEMKAVITFHAGKPMTPGFYFTAADDEPVENLLKTINEGLKLLQAEMKTRILASAPEPDPRLKPVSAADFEKTLSDFDERRRAAQEQP